MTSAVDDLSEAERALLLARALRLREAPAGEAEAERGLASFVVGGARFAFHLERVRAALPLRGVTPVPLAPPHVIGVLRFRGDVVTVFSLASLLGVRGWRLDPTVLLLVDVGGRVVAFDCEEIPTAIGVAARVVDGANAAGDVLVEIPLPDGATLTLIDDPARLLAAAPGATRAR